MSEQENEKEPGLIPDEELPDELVPGEDNPLAEGLPPGERAEGLLDPAEDSEDGQDSQGGQGADKAAEAAQEKQQGPQDEND